MYIEKIQMKETTFMMIYTIMKFVASYYRKTTNFKINIVHIGLIMSTERSEFPLSNGTLISLIILNVTVA